MSRLYRVSKYVLFRVVPTVIGVNFTSAWYDSKVPINGMKIRPFIKKRIENVIKHLKNNFVVSYGSLVPIIANLFGILTFWGTFEYPNGDVYVGDFKSHSIHNNSPTGQPNCPGVRNGHGTMNFSNGDIYCGQWLDDQMCGHGELKTIGASFLTFTNNSDKSPSPQIDDLPWYESVFKTTISNKIDQLLNSKIQYANQYNRLNKTYTGQFKDNKPCGYGILTKTDCKSVIYKGQWRDGMRHGKGTEYYEVLGHLNEIQCFEGIFVDGKCEELNCLLYESEVEFVSFMRHLE
jgi:hypothetical protein